MESPKSACLLACQTCRTQGLALSPTTSTALAPTAPLLAAIRVARSAAIPTRRTDPSHLTLPSHLQENLSRDSFLQKRVAQDPQGFVSLGLVNSFNRMRRIGLSEAEVASAITAVAHGVELDETKTKVRPRR